LIATHAYPRVEACPQRQRGSARLSESGMPWATTTERGSGMNPGIGRMTTGGRHRVSRWGAVLVPIFLILGTGVADAAVEVPIWGSRTARVSVSSLERQTNGPSYCCPAISKHGRHVAFQSDATNLVASD